MILSACIRLSFLRRSSRSVAAASFPASASAFVDLADVRRAFWPSGSPVGGWKSIPRRWVRERGSCSLKSAATLRHMKWSGNSWPSGSKLGAWAEAMRKRESLQSKHDRWQIHVSTTCSKRRVAGRLPGASQSLPGFGCGTSKGALPLLRVAVAGALPPKARHSSSSQDLQRKFFLLHKADGIHSAAPFYLRAGNLSHQSCSC